MFHDQRARALSRNLNVTHRKPSLIPRQRPEAVDYNEGHEATLLVPLACVVGNVCASVSPHETVFSLSVGHSRRICTRLDGKKSVEFELRDRAVMQDLTACMVLLRKIMRSLTS